MFINNSVRVNRWAAQRGLHVAVEDTIEHNLFSTSSTVGCWLLGLDKSRWFISICWGHYEPFNMLKAFQFAWLGHVKEEPGASAMMSHKGEEFATDAKRFIDGRRATLEIYKTRSMCNFLLEHMFSWFWSFWTFSQVFLFKDTLLYPWTYLGELDTTFKDGAPVNPMKVAHGGAYTQKALGFLKLPRFCLYAH